MMGPKRTRRAFPSLFWRQWPKPSRRRQAPPSIYAMAHQRVGMHKKRASAKEQESKRVRMHEKHVLGIRYH